MTSVLELKPYTSALYKIEKAKADGDCFYHAFIEQAAKLNSETPNTPQRLREALLELPDLDPRTVDRLRHNDWAQDQEIQATAELTGLCIFVWSGAQKLWFYHYPLRDNTQWQIDDCHNPVYLINVGNPIESSDLKELHSSDATTGYHFDGLVPQKSFRERLIQPEDEEGSEDEASDEELDILDDELMELLQDDDASDDESPSNGEDRDRYVAMSSMEKFKYVRKRLREYDTEKNAKKKYSIQRDLLSFRGDMNLDRLEETPEHSLVLDSSPYAKERFALTNNQRFLKKLISPETRNRAVLLFHGVGVGKTCSAVQIATNFSSFYTNRALVILPSSLEGNFRKELFDVDKVDFERRTYESCYGNRYLEKIPDWYSLSPIQLNKEAQSMINEQFEFMGFIRVVNAIMKIHMQANKNNTRKADAENEVATRIGTMFSHRVIVIDEVHNIRTGSDNSKEDRTKKQFPLALKKIIKHAVGIRLVLLSATPMFNDVHEIDWLTEIMFKCDRVPYEAEPVQFNTKGRLTSDSKNSLEYFARNYVSFMRGQDPSTFPDRLENEGEEVLRAHPTKDISGLREIEPVSTFPLTASKLSGPQKRAYREIIKNDAYGKHIKKLEQISNIAYPSEEGEVKHGQEGFAAMFEESINARKQIALSYREGSPKLTPNMLKKHACKMATILRHIREAEGIVMVFSFYIYSGLLPLAVALEHAGYVKYGGSLLKAPPPVTRKGAYIILTAKEGYSPDNHKQIRELNAAENSDGERIKVVLVGQVGSEGLDMRCVREVHIMEPWYHMNKIEQIIGRAVRFRSHERLPPSKRNVTIYRHVALMENAQAETLDYKNYRVSELKMRRIRQVEDILARYALDCPLNLEQNNRVRDKKPEIVDSRGRKRDSDAVQDRHKLVCAREVELKRDVSRLSPIVAADVIALAKQVIGYIESREAVYISFEKRAEVPSLLEVPQFQGRERLLKGALNWIVRTRAPIIINDIRGRLLQLEQAYLFQPERLHDIKLTRRDRLLAPEPRVGSYVISMPAASLGEDPVFEVDYEELLQKLELDLAKRRAIVVQSLQNPGTPDEEVLLDMVVDRLSSEELRVLMANFGNKKTKAEVRRSLKEGAVLIDGHPKLYFDYHEGRLRRLDGEKAIPLENDMAMADHRQAVLRDLGKEQATGFLSKTKGRYEFKMTNPSKANMQVGTNCVATSTIKKQDLVTFTAAHITPNKSSYLRLAKPGLCNVYEYALRTTNPKERHFLRPAQFEILLGKN